MKFNDYPEQINLNESDLILIWDSAASAVKKIKLSSLQAFLGTTTSPGNQIEINFLDNNNYEGVCYFLGTSYGASQWENPHTQNRLTVSASSIGLGEVSQLVDRQNNEFYTQSVDGSWIAIDFLENNSLECNYYSIKSHNAQYQYHPRNFKLQGSNNNITWEDLDVQINNSTLVNSSQWLSLPVDSNKSYRYLRILSGQDSSGGYYLILGEVEFYGIYKYQE